MSRPRFTSSAIRAVLVVLLALAALQSVTATKKPPLHSVNINVANSEELQRVPGIGPSTAEKILQMRKSYGAFKSVDDLKAISGLGPKRLEKMRKYLTIGRSPNSAKPAAKPAVHAAQTPNCKGCTKPAVNSKQAVVAVAPKTPATKPAESASSDSDDEEPELR